MAKCRLVICYDGTWNTPDKGAEPTNVVKLVRAVRNSGQDGTRQVVFYDKGVGTAGGTDALKGGTFGTGLTANVLDGYRFVANNHQDGDEIHLFGFSRGAYTARSLAGLIGVAGLLAPDHLGRGLLKVIEIYRRRDLDRAARRAAIDALGLERRPEVPIRSIGVWDTVGSLGIPGDIGKRFLDGKYYFHDVELGPNVDVALHAVAIDEKRGPFPPALWISGDGEPVRDGQIVEQVWLPGVHSNVGGSYADTRLSDIALDWMIRRLAAHECLDLDRSAVTGVGPANAAGAGIESRGWKYALSKAYPYQRIVNGRVPAGDGINEWVRRTFKAIDRRNLPEADQIPVNEALHVSALERWALPEVAHDCAEPRSCPLVPYRPPNLAAVVMSPEARRRTKVIDWDGAEMKPGDVPWPKPE